MNRQGFLGTNASLIADLALVLSLVVALTLTVGAFLAMRKRYHAHRWVQTTGVSLNILLVLLVMIGSFVKSAAPGIPQKLNEPYYYVATIHGLFGLFAFVFGTFVMLRGNQLVPRALRFRNYKLFMRTAYLGYMLVTALGVWVYVTWYGRAPDTAAAPVVAQATNEQIVPMANFAFVPQEIIVPIGATVVWVNQDGAPHTATADDGAAFASDLLSSGQSFRHTFTAVGEFPYFCELHGSAGGVDMAGVVKVVPADQAPALAAAPAVPPAQPTAQPTPPPLPAQPLGQPVGTAAFRDAAGRSDQLLIRLDAGTPPPAGQSLVAFLTTADGSATQNVGELALDADGQSVGSYTAPNGENLAARFSRFVISQEPSGSNPAVPGGPVVFEGALPPQAFESLTHLLASGPGLPTEQGYAVGLQLQADELERHAAFATNAQAAGDLAGLRRHAEHVYNLIAGSLDPQFGDLSGDGRSQNPGDGFGLLTNGAQVGYIEAVSAAAAAAASAPDTSPAIKLHAGHVQISAENMRGWATEARELALQLTSASDVSAASEQVARLHTLGQWLQRGNDANGDGEIAPIPGEGGSLVAYQHAQFMAGFGIVPAQR